MVTDKEIIDAVKIKEKVVMHFQTIYIMDLLCILAIGLWMIFGNVVVVLTAGTTWQIISIMALLSDHVIFYMPQTIKFPCIWTFLV